MKVRLSKLIAFVLVFASFASASVMPCASCHDVATVALRDAAHHDCCRAHFGKHTARHHVASRANDHEANCGAAHADPVSADATVAAVVSSASISDGTSTTASCCAGLPAQVSMQAAVATNDANGQRLSHLVKARSFVVTPPLHLAFAPTQHAPPTTRSRLHILNSVLLI